jgi:hypothetical protein
MPLPGGIRIEGELRRDFHFKPVTGLLELALSESVQRRCSHPERVTSVLCEALDDLGSMPPSHSLVRKLSVGDRQFLMRRLAVHIDDQLVWLTAKCGECKEPFDLSFRHSELPVKLAGSHYPEMMVETSQGPLLVRVPTGGDQEEVAAVQEEGQAIQRLLERLVSHQGSGEPLSTEVLSDGDIAAIESAAEEMAPEIAQCLLAQCPDCAKENQIPLTLYACMERPVGDLYREVHTLAANYHWSENDILTLPRSRRHTYLSLIDRSRGLNSADHFEGAR